MVKNGWWIGALVLATSWTMAGDVAAQDSCPESQADFQFANRTVPSTVAGALYRNCSSHSPEGTPNVEIFESESGDPVEIAIEQGRDGLFEIIFVDELEPHSEYTVQADPQCLEVGSEEMRHWNFETGEALELPEDIGYWTHTPIFQSEVTYDGPNSCTEQSEAVFVEWKYQASDEAGPWRYALAYETVVNDEVWEPQFGEGRTTPAGYSRVARGDDRIYVICDGDPPESRSFAATLDEALHNIRIDAWLPGTELRWDGDGTSLRLRCEQEEENEDNGEDDENGEEDDNGSEEEDGDSGCATVSGDTGPAFAALMLLGLVALRRRSKGQLD